MSLNKVLALLLSIVMVLGMCAFAEPVTETEEHVHEEEVATFNLLTEEEIAAEETVVEETVVEETVVEETVVEETVVEETVVEETVVEEVEDYSVSTFSISREPDNSTFIDENCGNHVYREGVCIVCGYACNHLMEGYDSKGTDYVVIDDTYHQVTYIEVGTCMNCGYCGQWEGSSSRTVNEEHSISEGACYRCGYVDEDYVSEECAHVIHTVDDEYDDWIDVKLIDDYTHEITWQKVKAGTCIYCQEWVYVNAGEPWTEVGNHSFSDYEWSFCNACDYKCKHPTTIDQNYYDQIRDGEWINECTYVDEKYHTVTMQLMQGKRCTVCSRASSVETGVFIEVQKEHYGDEECYGCGAVMSSESTECEHNWVETIEYQPWGKKLDEMTHEVTMEAWLTESCEFCGEVLSGGDYDDGDYTFVEEHSFATDGDGAMFFGECNVCSYKTDCAHDEMECSYFLDYVTYSNITDETHDETGMEFERWECVDCGLTYVNATGESKTETYDHDVDENGECDCGYTQCLHENKTATFVSERTIYFTEGSDYDKYHTIQTFVTESFTCDDCGADLGTAERNIVDGSEDHTFENGVCTLCEYACEHTESEQGEQIGYRTDYTVIDDSMHHYECVETYQYVCTNCGANTYTEDEVTLADDVAHTYDTDTCTACAHVCTHADKTLGAPVTEPAYECTDATHTATTKTTTPFDCNTCSKMGELEEYADGTAEAHTYVEGKCTVCEHVCTHSNAEVEVLTAFKSYADLVDATHTVVNEVTTVTECLDCGTTTVVAEDVKEEPAAHTYLDGMCQDCSYVCTHTTTADEVTEEKTACTSVDDQYHYFDLKITTDTRCSDCGIVVNTAVEETTSENIEHTYADGVCADCEHTCEHTSAETVEETFEAKSYAKKDGKVHTVTGDVHEIVYCDYCAAEMSDTVTAENQTREQAHAMSGGKCTLCGYVKPVATATPAPAATPAPVVEEEIEYVEVAVEETVHGVTAVEQPTMVETLVTVIETIETEAAAEGKTVALEIAHAEKVLAEEEHEEMTQLKVVEQMMVMLKVMGFDAEVDAALAEMEIELSEEATALVEEIKARIAEMTEEELAEFEKMMAELFEAMTDSEEEEDKEIIFQLKIEIDGVETYEAYSFKKVEEQWVLTKISVQAAEEALEA